MYFLLDPNLYRHERSRMVAALRARPSQPLPNHNNHNHNHNHTPNMNSHPPQRQRPRQRQSHTTTTVTTTTTTTSTTTTTATTTHTNDNINNGPIVNGMRLANIREMKRARDEQLRKQSQYLSRKAKSNGNGNGNGNVKINNNMSNDQYVDIQGRFTTKKNKNKNNRIKNIDPQIASCLNNAGKDGKISENQEKKIQQKLSKMMAEGKDITKISSSQLILDTIDAISDYDDDSNDIYDDDPVSFIFERYFVFVFLFFVYICLLWKKEKFAHTTDWSAIYPCTNKFFCYLFLFFSF